MSKSARIEDKDGDFDGSAWLLILTTCKSEPVRTAVEKLRSTQKNDEGEDQDQEDRLLARKADVPFFLVHIDSNSHATIKHLKDWETSQSADDVHKRTSAPTKDVKAVLIDSNWDIEAAQKELRRRGRVLALKKSSRMAAEGLLAQA
ncbi:unnamed protein product [Malus baccata var. baccata]